MEINKLLTPHAHEKGGVSRIKYIVIHYVGGLGGAEANCKYYAEGDRGASAHYYVGHAGEIWQSVEDANVAYHCGSRTGYKHPECRNSNSIGVEMCVRKTNTDNLSAYDKDWYYEDATVESAIELVKELMTKYKVPIENVIRHYDVTGKICPNPFVYNTGKHTWEAFKAALVDSTPTMELVTKFPKTPFDISVHIDDLNYRSLPTMSGVVVGQTGKGVFGITAVRDGWGKLKSGAGWVYIANPAYCTILGTVPNIPNPPFTVKVSIKDLNIRTGPGTNYTKTGLYTGIGAFTITEVKDGQGSELGWGKLKSGAGWISLDFAKVL